MRKYAEGTTVLADKSLADIKAILRKYGAQGFLQGENDIAGTMFLMFAVAVGTPEERRIRYTMDIPNPDHTQYIPKSSNGASKDIPIAQRTAARFKAEVDRRWRALALGIKGKLVLVEEGIETIEIAFYAHIVTPAGTTIYDETRPQIAEAYRTGIMPPLMPGLLPAPAAEAQLLERAK